MCLSDRQGGGLDLQHVNWYGYTGRGALNDPPLDFWGKLQTFGTWLAL